MTWTVTCPRCGRESTRTSASAHRPSCAHAYHSAEDCTTCIFCKHGLPWPPDVLDASGRWLAPAQDLPVRAPGPWDGNSARAK